MVMKTDKGAAVELCTNYNKLTDKNRKAHQSCFKFKSAQFCRIMENLLAIPMPNNHHLDSVFLHRLKIWPGYVAILNEYTNRVILCPMCAMGPSQLTQHATP